MHSWEKEDTCTIVHSIADDRKAIAEVKAILHPTGIVFASNEDEHVKWNQSVDFYQQSIELLHI